MDKDMEDEIYSFIVASNLEYILVSQCKDKETKKKLAKWFQIE